MPLSVLPFPDFDPVLISFGPFAVKVGYFETNCEDEKGDLWVGKKADDPKVVADAREAMLDDTEHEYRRLLYVAMTRAADRLIVAGIQPGNQIVQACQITVRLQKPQGALTRLPQADLAGEFLHPLAQPRQCW